jgi:HEPN domain-containing protein
MIDLKKKCWREKVTAEITLAHVLQFAREAGNNMNAAEVAAFLNEKGRAHNVWTHMMQAGEEYIKSSLAGQPKPRIHSVRPPAAQTGVVH